MRPLSVESFPSAFSRTLGKERKRRVCPVGAVSNTITEYSIDLTCLCVGRDFQFFFYLDSTAKGPFHHHPEG